MAFALIQTSVALPADNVEFNTVPLLPRLFLEGKMEVLVEGVIEETVSAWIGLNAAPLLDTVVTQTSTASGRDGLGAGTRTWETVSASVLIFAARAGASVEQVMHGAKTMVRTVRIQLPSLPQSPHHSPEFHQRLSLLHRDFQRSLEFHLPPNLRRSPLPSLCNELIPAVSSSM